MERVYLEKVDSTNKWAKESINSLENLTVVYTYNQTSGRGRLDRKWNYMGEGNIYASIVLKYHGTMREVYSNLTQYLCLVLAEVFEEYGVYAKIKWPNDLRVNGKKICGILAEGVNIGVGVNDGAGVNAEGNGEVHTTAVILGFGINLNCSQEDMDKIDQPATSLNILTGMEIDKEHFFQRVLDKFCLEYDNFIKGGFKFIRKAYKERFEFLNKQIRINVFDKTVEGEAIDITDQGALKILNNGEEQILYIGDIL